MGDEAFGLYSQLSLGQPTLGHPARINPPANSSPIKATTKILLFFIEKSPLRCFRIIGYAVTADKTYTAQKYVRFSQY
jgi:hypothetical protein